MMINRETFTELDAPYQPDHGYWIEGLVEVTFQGRTERVPAQKSSKGDDITVHCFTGRYQTGTKAWPASVTNRIHSGKEGEFAMFGRDDRSGRFNKMNSLSWDI